MTTIGEQIEALGGAMEEASKPKPRKVSYFKYGKFGLAEDPKWHNVALNHQGRRLLGTVRDFRIEQRPGGTTQVVLDVRHFNGEPWPISPIASVVEVIR